jgi:hypothetical protein
MSSSPAHPRPESAENARRAARLRARIWRHTRNHELVYRAIVAVKHGGHGRAFVDRRTDLVIDGFERSGNTFAYLAFVDANGTGFRVAHHTHSPVQMSRAARWQRPAVLLVRDPCDVARSVVLRWSVREVGEVLADWVNFHQRVLTVLDHVVVAPFPVVTTRFGRVINQVNERFGTAFAPFADGPEAEARVFAAIDARNQQRYGRLLEGSVARPSDARSAARASLDAEFERAGTRLLVAESRALFSQITAEANSR